MKWTLSNLFLAIRCFIILRNGGFGSVGSVGFEVGLLQATAWWRGEKKQGGGNPACHPRFFFSFLFSSFNFFLVLMEYSVMLL